MDNKSQNRQEMLKQWEKLKADPRVSPSLKEIEKIIPANFPQAYKKWVELAKQYNLPVNMFDLFTEKPDHPIPVGETQKTESKGEQTSNTTHAAPPPQDSLFLRAIENLKREKAYNAVPFTEEPEEEKKIVEKATDRAAVVNISENRSSEEYKKVQQEALEEWSRKQNIQLNDKRTEEYKKSEEFQDLSDKKFLEKHKDEKDKFLEEEKTRIYKNPADDPIVKELDKLLSKKVEQKGIRESDINADSEVANSNIRVFEILKRRMPEKFGKYEETIDEKVETRKTGVFDSFFSNNQDENDQKKGGKLRALNQLRRLFFEEKTATEAPKIETKAPLQQRAGFVDRINRLEQNAGRFFRAGGETERTALRGGSRLAGQTGSRIAGGLGRGGGQVLMRAGTTVAAVSWEVWLVIIIILVILLLILLIIMGLSSMGSDSIIVSKVADKQEVPNPVEGSTESDITYTISVSGNASSATIVDPIPQNALFVSATGNYELAKDASGNIKEVRWRVSSQATASQSSSSAQVATPAANQKFTFDPAKFRQYGFPNPTTPTVMSSSVKNRWQKYMMPHAVKASSLLGIDIGWVGMWAWVEDSFNTYMDNCRDNEYDPNTYCTGWNGQWQVGYGNHPAYMINYLKPAMSAMHPGKSAQQIGQKVIEDSKIQEKYSGKFRPITNPSTFPNKTADEIISGAKNGNQESRILLGILMKDDAVGTYLVAQHFKDLTSQHRENLASVMNRWTSGGYYAPQKIINYIAGIYQTEISGNEATQEPSISGSFNLTVRPKQNIKDTYIVNQAYAEGVFGSCTSGSYKTITLDPGHPSETSGGTSTTIGGTTYSENKINWEIANKIKPMLENKGYRVVMTKKSESQKVTNKDRAEIANKENSSLFFRIHIDAENQGYFLVYPHKTGSEGLPSAENINKGKQASEKIIAGIESVRSKAKGLPIQQPTVLQTDADTYVGSNAKDGLLTASRWSNVPTSLIEMGGIKKYGPWLSNAENQKVLAEGIATGIDQFLGDTKIETCELNTVVSSQTGTVPGSKNACSGKYNLSKTGGINFGDPACSLAQSEKTQLSGSGKSWEVQKTLVDYLSVIDLKNTTYWVGISHCESTLNPNAVNPNATNSTAYGLVQMAGENKGNGEYDRGDLNWEMQIKNAIDYQNKVLIPLGINKWRYWACAKKVFGLWK